MEARARDELNSPTYPRPPRLFSLSPVIASSAGSRPLADPADTGHEFAVRVLDPMDSAIPAFLPPVPTIPTHCGAIQSVEALNH